MSAIGSPSTATRSANFPGSMAPTRSAHPGRWLCCSVYWFRLVVAARLATGNWSKQDGAYREHVLPDAIDARVAVEQAAVVGWERYVGRHGAMVGMHTFGASAPLKGLLARFGFTVEHVMQAARGQIAKHRG